MSRRCVPFVIPVVFGLVILCAAASASAGTVSGVVTNASNGVPLAGITIQVRSQNGTVVNSTTTDGSGVYTMPALTPGNYRFRTVNLIGYIDEVYDNAPCLQCSNTTGTLVEVLADPKTGIDFALTPGARVAGTVTDAVSLLPIAGVQVRILSGAGTVLDSVITDGSGNYLSGTGVPTGSYRIQVRNTLGYISEAYDNVACVGTCPATSGPLTALTAGVTRLNTNFALTPGGLITGAVTDASNSAPISGVTVSVYTDVGVLAVTATTNASGVYLTDVGLPTGSYRVMTGNTTAFINEAFNDVACTGTCPVSAGSLLTVTAGSTRSGVDFGLRPAGRITGTITDATTGTPLNGVSVTVFSALGVSLGNVTSNASGVYLTTAGLPTGTYYVQTVFDGSGHINEAYGDIACPAQCPGTTGTAVSVSSSATTTAIDFALSPGGRISGVVTDAANSTPLPGVAVGIWTQSGTFITNVTADQNGAYQSTVGLSTGSYRVTTSNSLGYVNEAYNDLACVGACGTTTGGLITVTAGATTGGIDFALVKGGRVSGTVTDVQSGLPLAGVTVSLVMSNGTVVGSTTTDAAGSYQTTAVPTGSYRLMTANTLGYLNEVYDDVVCLTSCQINLGASVIVTAGATTSGINLALARGGRITGRVTDAVSGYPLVNQSITIRTANGTSAANATTDGLGMYVSPTGLVAGEYHVLATGSDGYIGEAYDDVTCAIGCSGTSGITVTVAAGQTTSDIDFALTPGGRIFGTVTDEATGLPLNGVTISIRSASGLGAGTAGTNASGMFLTRSGLPTGSYRVVVSNSAGYVNEAYDNVVCIVSCDGTAGGSVPVTAGATTFGVNFSLVKGVRFSGTITDGLTGAPLSGVNALIYDLNGRLLTNTSTNALGQYSTSVGLPAGDYRVATSNSLGYLNEAYNDVGCGVSCNGMTGTVITAAAGAIVGSIDFALIPGGHISGRVTDAVTGAPVAGASMDVYNQAGGYLTGTTTDASGQYTVTSALATGSYRIRTSNVSGYINEAFDNIACAPCPTDTGALVAVTAASTTAGIDFHLARGASFTGTVTAASGGAPISGVNVYVYSAQGTYLTYGTTNSAGVYALRAGLPAGAYYLRTSTESYFVDQLYPGIALPELFATRDIAQGTLVSVADGESKVVNFSLAPGGLIAAHLTSASDGAALPNNTRIEIFTAAGAQIDTVYSGSGGAFTSNGLPPGSYRVVTRNTAGFIDEAYDNVPCTGCDMSSAGTLVTVTGGMTTNIDMALATGGGISGTVTRAGGGAPVNATLEVYTPTGRLVGLGYTDGSGAYTILTGLAPGNYFVKTVNTVGLIDEVYPDIACVGCTPQTGVGTAVTVTGTAVTTGIDFVLESGGSISGKVTDAITGLPIYAVDVEVHDTGGNKVATTSTPVNGVYTIAKGLPAGSYRVRTRNAWGYANEAFDNVPCSNCAASTGTLVTVAAGATTQNIDFALTHPLHVPDPTDTDGDGMSNAFETVFGLDPNDARGVNGTNGQDTDDDGRTNLQEFIEGTHPRGFYKAYFAEGATSAFFEFQLALLNTSPATPALMQVRYLLPAPTAPATQAFTLAPQTRKTIRVNDVAGMGTAEASTAIESDAPFVADRTLSWDVASGFGAHAETAVAAPATTWYLAEGATHSGFNLFYLLQNPNAVDAQVRVRFLTPTGAPLEKTYTLPPTSRSNIWVNQEDFPGLGLALAATDVSAVIDSLNAQPIIVERALYLDLPGQTFGAGHDSAGVTAPSTQWFLAEGATGPYFDLFVLVANPGNVDADVEATYLLPSGATVVKTYQVKANSRFNIWVDWEDAQLNDTAVSTTVRTTNGVPVIVERALWWPGSFGQWYEAHNSPGATATGTTWALAEGEVGGVRGKETFILLANTSSQTGSIRVTLYFEDGTSDQRTFTVAGNSRFNVDARAEFPSAVDRRFGAIVESLGPNAVPIVVERAMYWDALGQHWAAGTNASAKKLQ